MPAADPQTRLRVNGVEVADARARGDIVLTRSVLRDLDGPDQVEFAEFGTLAPTLTPGARVGLDVAFDANEDGTLAEAEYVARFAGEIASAPTSFGQYGPQVDYACPGLKHRAARVRVCHPASGKTEIGLNLPPDDEDYDPGLAGLELGDILRILLTYDFHATRLWHEGVAAFTADPPLIDPLRPELGRAYNMGRGQGAVLKAATLADLDAMTVVPVGGVRVSGRSLWQQVESLVQDWMPSRGVEIEADGTIRFHDLDNPQWLELRLGVDPVAPPSLSLDVGECYTAVEVVGGDNTEGRTFDTQSGGLVADWTAAEQAGWKWADFQTATDATCEGAVVGVGPTTVSVRAQSGRVVWPVNYWSNLQAFVEVRYTSGGVTFSESRRVVSCTASSGPASTAVLTLDYPLANSGYTTFRITGIPTGPRAHVWRRYRFADQAAAARIVQRFAFPFPWTTSIGTELVSSPQGVNYRRPGSTGDPFQTPFSFAIFRDADGLVKVLANVPTVKSWTSQANLDLGGAGVNAPTNVLVFVPVSTGLLTARFPEAGFAGEGFTRHGIARVLTIPAPDWRYAGDRQRQYEYARETHKVVSVPAVSGSITYLGLWRPAVETPNLAVKLTSAYGATPWEAIRLTVRSREIQWPETGATNHVTVLRVSNERKPWRGERSFTPASFLAGDPLEGRSIDARGA